MKTTRAYLAGFGSASTLVIAAAVLFVLGSAVVAFDGWPTLGAGVAPMTQVVSVHGPSHARHGHAVAPKVATVASPAVAPPATLVVSRTVSVQPSGSATPTGRKGGTRHHRGATVARTHPVSTGTPSGQAPATSGSAGATIAPSGNPAPGAAGTVTTVVTKVTGILNKVTGAGNRVIGPGKKLGIRKKLAGLIGPTGAATGKTLNQVTGSAGQPVSGVGQTVGQTVTTVSGPVGTVLSGAGVTAGASIPKLTGHLRHDLAASGSVAGTTVSATTASVGRAVGHGGQPSGRALGHAHSGR